MTKLKTLKYLDYSADVDDKEEKSVLIEDLKQEAIRWVKYWQQLIDGDYTEKQFCEERIVCFKHFFNLTEEDLK